MKEGDEDEMGSGGAAAAVMPRKPTPSRPQLVMNSMLAASSSSNSTTTSSSMALVANFLAEHDPDDSASFSSLLAGAINAEEKQAGSSSAKNSNSLDAAANNNPSNNNHNNNNNNNSNNNSNSHSNNVDKVTTANANSSSRFSPESGSGSGPIRPATARFKSMPPSRIPIPKAPCVTIPPGLSPTTLLDSPVLLSSHHAEPSPTTGTYPLPSLSGEGGAKLEPSKDTNSEHSNSGFVFKPFAKPGSRNCLSPLGNMAPPFSFPTPAPAPERPPPSLQQQHAAESPPQPSVPLTTSPLPAKNEQPSPNEKPAERHSQSPSNPPPAPERASDDGYNWRKYGQKLVKGSDNPRSYYKCTYVNCPMKKKVERSPDGQVTEIVYEGEHNHPKPQPTRRSAMNSLSSSKAFSLRSEPKAEGSDSLRSQSNGADQSSSSTSDDEGNEDEPDAKRRKKEKPRESPAVPRTIREPRVVVQTTSEVDVLDDGYRWRKYGQKVVKGNPHPRSYYKCTNLGCPVRKHVERASDDPRAVITTYEGKHNHDVPAARGSPQERAAVSQSVGVDASSSAVSFSSQQQLTSSQDQLVADYKQQQQQQRQQQQNQQDGNNSSSKVVKGEELLPTGSPARISAATSLSSLISRPKAEPLHDGGGGSMLVLRP